MTMELAFAARASTLEMKRQTLLSNKECLADWLLSHDQETGGRHAFDLPFDKRTWPFAWEWPRRRCRGN